MGKSSEVNVKRMAEELGLEEFEIEYALGIYKPSEKEKQLEKEIEAITTSAEFEAFFERAAKEDIPESSQLYLYPKVTAKLMEVLVTFEDCLNTIQQIGSSGDHDFEFERKILEKAIQLAITKEQQDALGKELKGYFEEGFHIPANLTLILKLSKFYEEDSELAV